MIQRREPTLAIAPLQAPPHAAVRLPGSKSITNRALVCAALASGETTIEGALFADDTEAMAAAAASLGAEVRADPTGETVTVRGVAGRIRPRAGAVIDARRSGTTGRFLLAVAAMAERPVTVDGHPQLRERPFADLVDALRRLGATVEQPSGGASLPLRVTGPIRRSEATVAADRSSQFVSGLMLAAPLAPGGLTLRLDGPAVSRPYLHTTAAVMAAFGATAEVRRRTVLVAGGGYRSPGRFAVEPDASAASYFWAAAAVTGGAVRVEGIAADSIQGDARFAWLLEEMGATVASDHASTTVAGGPLRGVDVDLGDISDTAPTLAVVAALSQGATTVRGIGFVRGKESDRIAAAVAELRRCGARAGELPDGFVVQGAGAAALSGARIRTYDDHRMAMAFSVLGLVVPGVLIENPGCVAKTFPGFYEALATLRGVQHAPAARPGISQDSAAAPEGPQCG